MASQPISVPNKLRPKRSSVYPAVVFKTRLEVLMKEHPARPTPYDLAVALEVTPPTIYKYLRGCSVPLLHAMQLAAMLSPVDKQLTVDDVWTVR